jgi:phenylalanyl-tRNA synthetase beta chain
MLNRMAPTTVPLDELAWVMNARVSEVEKVHGFPSREDLAEYSIGAGPAGLQILRPDGSPATEADLGIGEDGTQPVLLGPDVQAGADVFDTLELDDHILEFDLEPNRPDLYSLSGMARDSSAIWGGKLTLPELHTAAFTPLEGISIQVEATDKVPRYAALEVHGIQVGPSPQWLQNAVRKLGMRPINNVVDATNLAMMELGEPMHTFDRREIQSGIIGLRMARQGEKITTLDGVERTLTDECLLVTDGDKPVALAGIMGTAGSGVRADTTDLVIEAASFDMASVRRASRRLSLRSEASLRFEKGLPDTNVGPAMRRLAQLLLQVGGPKITIGGFAEHWPSPAGDRTVQMTPATIRTRLAMDVSDTRQAEILTVAGCTVDTSSTPWAVTLPAHRPDLRIPEDLVEEVGRIHGYEHVDAQLPTAQMAPVPHNPLFWRGSQVRRCLAAHGLDEVYLSTWIGDDDVATYAIPTDDLITLKNPLVENWKH